MAVPYQPLEPKGHKLTVGIRPLAMQNWLECDSNRLSELAAKAVLRKDLVQVFAEIEMAREASWELHDLVIANLKTFHNAVFEVGEDGSVHDLHSGLVHSEPHPLLSLGDFLQEDFCIMSKLGSEWILSAAILYSPSRWSLLDKIGKSLEGIHTPVPDYQSKLGKAVEQLFDRITVDKPVWRTNWTIVDNPERFQPQPPTAAERRNLNDLDLGSNLYFRVERQTLVKLPKSGAVAFTIRTYVNTLNELLAARAENRELLITSLETTSDAHSEYRGWQEIKPKLLDYLILNSTI